MTDARPAEAVRFFRTPFGRMGVAATARGLARVVLPNQAAAARRAAPRASAGQGRADALAARAQRQILEYLAGRRRTFALPLDLAAVPPFHRKAMQAACRIPYGRTVTYAALARRAGSAGAARAAGQAMARNPLALVVPCHRVVATGGGLGGYGGGLALKRRLLALERG